MNWSWLPPQGCKLHPMSQCGFPEKWTRGLFSGDDSAPRGTEQGLSAADTPSSWGTKYFGPEEGIRATLQYPLHLFKRKPQVLIALLVLRFTLTYAVWMTSSTFCSLCSHEQTSTYGI